MSRCEKCAGSTSMVYHATEHVCVGWYCPRCMHVTKAIGRERQLPIEEKPSEHTATETVR